jgi:hypothetical protein
VFPDRPGVETVPAADDPAAVDPATAGGAGPGQERADLPLAAPPPLGLRLQEGAAALATAPGPLSGDAKPPVPPSPVACGPCRAPGPPPNPAESPRPAGSALPTGLGSSGLALPLAGLGTGWDGDGTDARLIPAPSLRLGLVEVAAADRAAPRRHGASASLRVRCLAEYGLTYWRGSGTARQTGSGAPGRGSTARGLADESAAAPASSVSI